MAPLGRLNPVHRPLPWALPGREGNPCEGFCYDRGEPLKRSLFISKEISSTITANRSVQDRLSQRSVQGLRSARI